MTNYDRIKAMSVEEMAEAIINSGSDPCDYCKYKYTACQDAPCRNKRNIDIISEWLQSEEEE